MTTKEQRTANRHLVKKGVQCLNEALCFVSSSVLAESLDNETKIETPSEKSSSKAINNECQI
jgi:hypothetical protein